MRIVKFCLFVLSTVCALEADELPTYSMITAILEDEQVNFPSSEAFLEAINVGFFRIKAPEDLDLEAGRRFAETFTSDSRYVGVGKLDDVNGYLLSEMNQTVRFTLERDRWQEYYPESIQELGHAMNAIGIKVLRSILTQYGLPEEIWFKATAGASQGEGSHFLLFNCYDPALSDRPFGVGEHKDWGHITVLDAHQPGLQARIDGVWYNLQIEDGYLIVNFGYPLEKMLPGVHACEHRVMTQTSGMRTSTVAFVDPRVGPYREAICIGEDQGYVYDWNPETKVLENEKPTTLFFKELSDQLYGINQSGQSEAAE